MRRFGSIVLVSCLVACGQSNDGPPTADASASTDVMILGETAVPPPPDAGPRLSVGITSATVFAGAPATVTTTPSGDSGPFTYVWTISSAPTGSQVTSVSSTSGSATITPDVVGDYTLALLATSVSGASAYVLTTIHAVAASVFFLRTTISAGGGILDVHVAGHDGSGSHGVACTTSFDSPQAADARSRTMLSGAGGMDVWEAPAGQPARFALAAVVSLQADSDGGYAVSLMAGTDQSSCNSAPQTLRALTGAIGALGQPQFSPDGSRVAFLEPAGASFRIATVGFDGTGYRAIAPVYPGGAPPDGGTDESSNIRVAWKDGATLAWAQPGAGGAWSLVTAPDTAGAATSAAFTCAGSTPHHVAFLADGSLLAAYAPAAGAPTDLVVLHAASGACAVTRNLTSLTGASSRAHDFALSPDGKTVAFLRYDATAHGNAGAQNNEGDLAVAPVDGSAAPTAVPALTTGRIGPRWIGGGTRLAWTRAATPTPGPDGGNPAYAEAVSVVLPDGGEASDLAVGNGADVVVAGVGPGGSCALARGPVLPAGVASLFLAFALAALVSRRRR